MCFSCASSCSFSSSSYDKKFFQPQEIENRGTFSEKIGKAVVRVISNSFSVISTSCKALNNWVFTPIWDYVLRPALKTINNVFTSILTRLQPVESFLKNSIGQPIINQVLKPLIRLAENTFEFIKTGFTNIGKSLNEWVLTPITEHLLSPMHDAISNLCNSIKSRLAQDFVSLGKNLKEWVLTPIVEYGLKPVQNTIYPLFKSFHTGLANLGSALKERVFTPIYDNILKPVWESIKPFVKSSLTTLNDWTFKPLFNGLGDFFHGIFIGSVVEECSIEKLEADLKVLLDPFIIEFNEPFETSAQLLDLLNEIKAQMPADSEISFFAQNNAMALYLAKNHSLVIDSKWIKIDRICNDLKLLVINKTKLTKEQL